jgi:hypothetical protein
MTVRIQVADRRAGVEPVGEQILMTLEVEHPMVAGQALVLDTGERVTVLGIRDVVPQSASTGSAWDQVAYVGTYEALLDSAFTVATRRIVAGQPRPASRPRETV